MKGTRAQAVRLLAIFLGLSHGCAPDSGGPAAGRTPPAPISSVVRGESPSSRGRIEESEEISAPDPTPSDPVKASMRIRPTNIPPGEPAELQILVRVARAHYIHAAGEKDGKFTPLAVDLTLPDGIATEGDWIFPTAESRNGSPIYRDSVLLKRSLRVASSLSPGPIPVGVLVRFQACTEDLCWPPVKVELSASLSVVHDPR